MTDICQQKLKFAETKFAETKFGIKYSTIFRGQYIRKYEHERNNLKL